MKFTLAGGGEFIHALKICHQIDQQAQFFLSQSGMLILSNYRDFDTIATEKPSYFCYLHNEHFSELRTNYSQFPQGPEASPELRIKFQALNGKQEHAIFNIQITQIYPALKAIRSKIVKIEFQYGTTIRNFVAARLLRIIAHLEDSCCIFEIPVCPNDDPTEKQQMDLIRDYCLGPTAQLIFQLNKPLNEFFLRQTQTLDLTFHSSFLNIQGQNNQNVELKHAIFEKYNFSAFKQQYPNHNHICIKSRILRLFRQFYLHLEDNDAEKARLILSSQSETQHYSMVLKCTTVLRNKPLHLNIYQQENEDEIVDRIIDLTTTEPVPKKKVRLD